LDGGCPTPLPILVAMKIESFSDLIGPKGGMAGRSGVIHNNKIPSSRSHFFSAFGMHSSLGAISREPSGANRPSSISQRRLRTTLIRPLYGSRTAHPQVPYGFCTAFQPSKKGRIRVNTGKYDPTMKNTPLLGTKCDSPHLLKSRGWLRLRSTAPRSETSDFCQNARAFVVKVATLETRKDPKTGCELALTRGAAQVSFRPSELWLR
jgi:hypothetical protein